ncbi:acetate--CoA ligase family protein [Amycolatopsis sp. OK19-0408]|uniref:Acetate--CoA ligase family protein n=1 Tax=Amycolatopsis iheyensis TaxID=2945988 RepID=A0A9X2SJB1_9PSEU|nr:acetate--CoA ligase family protein [Amycolatopsis iheyensis]MCR6482080.1 acetate--CoA ligase family protein [Amycolatopsis iheyensis]
MNPGLRRLLNPRRVVVAGGAAAAEAVVVRSRELGFAGEIWPVHPRRRVLAGLPCFPSVADLPGVPDAAFLSVPARSTVDLVGELARVGAGGVVCHASGFAEAGDATLEAELAAAAGDLALLGPNCLGFVNYLDGVALWPEQHGGHRTGRGVAVLSQSGNVAHNLSMQRRGLPLACLVTIGNAAVTGVPELVDTLAADPRVTAIGLYLEAVDDPAGLAAAARRSLAGGVPVVAVKSGTSEAGARATLSHTSALATSDALCSALFAHAGIARVPGLPALVETLKFLHVHGPLDGPSLVSASCSGGEAALVADAAEERGLRLPGLPRPVRERLRAVLGDRVEVANPLDYHTYIWGDAAAQEECFTALLGAGADNHLLVLDFPREDRCRTGAFDSTVDAFVRAARTTGAPASVVATLPENLPEERARRLLEAGIAPMHGLGECLDAIAAAAWAGQARLARPGPLAVSTATGATVQVDEWESKQDLRRAGVPIPEALLTDPRGAVEAAEALGYPVVLKAVSAELAHKTEAGAVRLDLRDAEAVRLAAKELGEISPRLLVERMVTGVVAELIVGVRADPRFGLALTLGSGGTLVELLADAATVLLPATRADFTAAIHGLRARKLIDGHRGRPPGDLDALLDAVESVAAYALSEADRLVELDVNPLLVLRHGIRAVDAVIVRSTG